ncbi:3-methylfumaryl-CoA hydratase [Paraburkholderia caballeronis]|uniref:FAS1-like dehydratase domain-containing protein n=1 Tax=Paraburkholderia caballeronis TaxID=416943 RepID=UPI001066BAF6|nr:MaoC family dehydratase N-terminal domain-containing protein [Paraburkholderia caballeronis]TDV35619.1 3-methylfumaryl-CoA hydratase [Paraburkholderia caballeronis]
MAFDDPDSNAARTETRVDQVDPFRAAAAVATLGAPNAFTANHGEPLPELWHWMFCAPPTPIGDLGHDGHPKRGLVVPPDDLPRRMWAGGRVVFRKPPRVGDTMERTSRIASVRETAGRSGRLLFVTVQHRYSHAGGVLIDEEQDLVYRAAAGGGAEQPAPGRPARDDADWQRTVHPDPLLLFRYSALTFNSHRIHYDRDYAMHSEGYAGLVVHGPLVATLLAGLAADATRTRLAGFSFRGVRPLVDTLPFSLCGKLVDDGAGVELWTRDAAGFVTMEARATLESRS